MHNVEYCKTEGQIMCIQKRQDSVYRTDNVYVAETENVEYCKTEGQRMFT